MSCWNLPDHRASWLQPLLSRPPWPSLGTTSELTEYCAEDAEADSLAEEAEPRTAAAIGVP